MRNLIEPHDFWIAEVVKALNSTTGKTPGDRWFCDNILLALLCAHGLTDVVRSYLNARDRCDDAGDV